MADTPVLSKITLSGTTYDLKDAHARELLENLSGAIHYRGVTTTALEDGDTTNPITIDNKSYTAVSGDVVIYQTEGTEGLEFLFNGTKWNEFGSTGSLKALAFKDTASGNISATDSGHTHTYDKTSKTHSVTQGTVSASGSFTPAGSITTGTGTANYTPAGTNASSAVSLTGGETKKLVTTNLRGVSGTTSVPGSPTVATDTASKITAWSAGTMFSASVSGETLTLTPGTAPSMTYAEQAVVESYTEGTAVTVATADANATTVATGAVDASGAGATVATALPTGGTAAAQTFTGTGAELKFTGTQDTVSVSGTTSGVSVADHTQTSTNTGSGAAVITGTVTVS